MNTREECHGIITIRVDKSWAEREVEKAAVLQVVKTVWIEEEGDGVDGERANADDRQTAEETTNSIRFVHGSRTGQYVAIATSSHVCLQRYTE